MLDLVTGIVLGLAIGYAVAEWRATKEVDHVMQITLRLVARLEQYCREDRLPNGTAASKDMHT